MMRGVLPLVIAGTMFAAGCAGHRPADTRLYARNQVQADYRDDVTGRGFIDRSNPVKVEVIRFGSFTSTSNAQTMIVNTPPFAAASEFAMRGAQAEAPPVSATGVRMASVARDVGVPTPVTGFHPPAGLERGEAVARMTGETGLMRFASWREVLGAEGRNRAQVAAATTGTGQLVQWPGGVHEIDTDVSLSTILLREDIGVPKAPIVVLDFLTRFNQRPQLKLTKTADPERALVGETITYKVTFFNDSPVEASNVLLADVVDQNCEYKPGSATCSRASTFEVTETAEKRPVLIWRLKDPVGPHDAGTMTYELVVRKPFVK